jgi:signal transduction histidine kinase
MTHLLEDILTIGKTEQRKIQINKSAVNIPMFFEKIIDEVEMLFAQSHKINFKMNGLSRTEIYSDEDLMRNIFINLMTNAIKFSPGKNSVSLQAMSSNGHIVIEVMDEGIGIPEGDLGKIFEPFDRGSNVMAIEGTGLGLSIVKKAVDLLDGKIAVTSSPGKGTTFVVKIPV